MRAQTFSLLFTAPSSRHGGFVWQRVERTLITYEADDGWGHEPSSLWTSGQTGRTTVDDTELSWVAPRPIVDRNDLLFEPASSVSSWQRTASPSHTCFTEDCSEHELNGNMETEFCFLRRKLIINMRPLLRENIVSNRARREEICVKGIPFTVAHWYFTG